MSYCTGASGRENFESTLADAASAFERKTESNIEDDNSDDDKNKSDKKKHKKKKKKKDKKKHIETDDFETQVAKAMEKQRKEEEELDRVKDERKRAYNTISGGFDKELTEAVSEY